MLLFSVPNTKKKFLQKYFLFSRADLVLEIFSSTKSALLGGNLVQKLGVLDAIPSAARELSANSARAQIWAALGILRISDVKIPDICLRSERI